MFELTGYLLLQVTTDPWPLATIVDASLLKGWVRNNVKNFTYTKFSCAHVNNQQAQ